MSVIDIITILPPVIVTAWAILLLIGDLWIPRDRKGLTALLAAFGLAIALGVDLALGGAHSRPPAFHGMVVLDGFAVYANVLILGSALLGVALAYDHIRRTGIERGEYYILLLLSTAGMMLMVQAYDMIVIFLALELLSIPLYVLAGFARPRPESEEASLKYFLLGTFASAFVLYGTSLIYGATAHTDLGGIVAAVQTGGSDFSLPLLLVGAALVLIGLGFKVSAVPFHMWTPDVYQGAPTPVTAFMAVAVKVAGLGALLRVFIVAFPSIAAQITSVVWALAALTMIVGNVLAIVQTNIKRLLAYSSIAHVGYLLMAFVSFGQGQVVSDAVAATLFYLVGYGLTSFAAWGVVIAAEQKEGRGLELDDYAGLGRKYPWLGVAMMAAMFSFTGIPPTLGFWGKFYVFEAAVKAGAPGLALIGLLTSLFSAYYYLRVLVVMYMRPGEPAARQEGWLNLVTIASAAAVVVLSFFPGAIYDLAAKAMLLLSM
ncbi:MAG TPA: NADH-quinone oxidoreductase subunit N [Anaerolineaceae bacterium]